MPTPPTPSATSPEDSALPPQPVQPRRKLSRRASLIGTVIALLVAAGLAWLAWDLTRPEETAAVQRGAGGARGGAPGGPGGGGGSGRTATTVGVATAEAADIPVNIEALGT